MAVLGTTAGRTRFQRARVLFALVMRELGARSGASRWSYFWIITEPVGGIILLTAAFSIALHKPPMGNNFALFYATGVVPFSMYTAVANSVSGTLAANRGLLTYPVVTIVDTIVARWLVETLTHSLIALGLFTSIILYYDLALLLRMEHIAIAFLAAAMLGLGIGTMNCVLYFYFPLWKNIWGMLNRPLFLLSGIMFTLESLPPQIGSWMWFNPLIHVVGQARKGFYGSYEGTYISLMFVFCLSLGLFLTGSFLILRNHARMIQN